jgi:hypothetical protein
MASSYEVAQRWAEVMRGTASRNLTARNVYFEGRTIYSYGRHFPLAEYLEAGPHGRRRPLVLFNGDRFSVTTSRHQNEVRSAVQTYLPGVETIILPYSALEAARVSRETIRPLEVLADRWETFSHESPRWEDLPLHERFMMVEVAKTAETLEAVPSDKRGRWQNGAWAEIVPLDGLYHWTGYEKVRREADSDGLYRWTTNRHFLGGSLFTAETAERVTRRRPITVLDVIDSALMRIDTRLEDLGETIAETLQRRPRRKYLSGFDANERIPLYFLATLPATSAQTVEAAVDSLAPRAVHAAYARGLDVERQGDMFAIETMLETAEVYGRARRRTRRTVWAGNGRPKVGETGYLEPAEAVERIRALYLQNRRAGWTSDKPRTTKPVPPAEIPPTPPAYAERIAEGRKRVVELEAALEAIGPLSDEAVPPALEAARNAARAADTSTVRHYRNEARYARETLEDRKTRYPDSEPSGTFARLIAEAEAEVTRTAERYAEATSELEAAESALAAAEAEYPEYMSREAVRLEAGRIRDELEGYSGIRPRLERDERLEANRIADYIRTREAIKAENRAAGRPRFNGPEKAASALGNARWTVNSLNTAELAEVLSLHGTAHTATEVVKAAGGLVYVRGYLYHEPALDGPDRPRDHARRKLGDGRTWYLAIRNTVPRNRLDGRR